MGAWIPFVPKLHPLVVIAEGYRDRLAVSLSSCPAVQNGRPVGAAPSSDAEGVVLLEAPGGCEPERPRRGPRDGDV